MANAEVTASIRRPASEDAVGVSIAPKISAFCVLYRDLLTTNGTPGDTGNEPRDFALIARTSGDGHPGTDKVQVVNVPDGANYLDIYIQTNAQNAFTTYPKFRVAGLLPPNDNEQDYLPENVDSSFEAIDRRNGEWIALCDTTGKYLTTLPTDIQVSNGDIFVQVPNGGGGYTNYRTGKVTIPLLGCRKVLVTLETAAAFSGTTKAILIGTFGR